MHTEFPQFVSDLLHNGHVHVTDVADNDITDADRSATRQIIREFEVVYRLELPGHPQPSFELEIPAATWAAEMIFRTCQVIANRHHSAEKLRELFGTPNPTAESAAQVYSIDIIFRLLPNLRRLAKLASEEDPLLNTIDHWCQAYPLSSIGTANCEATITSTILGDPSLLRLYVDRVLAADDATRATDPTVNRELLQSVGTHKGLRAKLGPKLQAVLLPSSAATETSSN